MRYFSLASGSGFAKLLFVVALFACGKKQETPAAPPTPTLDLGAKFAACWTAWSAGDDKTLGTCYTNDAVTESPGAGFPPATHLSAVLEAARQLKSAFPDIKGEPQLVLINHQKLAAVVRLTGTEATQKKPIGVLGGVAVDYDGHGLATHESDYFDTLTIKGQIVADTAHPVRAWDTSSSLAKQTIVATGGAAEVANIGVINALTAAMNKHDLAGFGALVADDAIWSDAAEAKDWTKPDLIADRTAGLQGFPDITEKVQDLWAAGDFVVEVAELQGTNDGAMPGIAAPTHKKIAVPYLAIYQVVAAKVAHAWVFDQGAAFVTQLGLK